jgi:hypothetical protein
MVATIWRHMFMVYLCSTEIQPSLGCKGEINVEEGEGRKGAEKERGYNEMHTSNNDNEKKLSHNNSFSRPKMACFLLDCRTSYISPHNILIYVLVVLVKFELAIIMFFYT